MSSENIDFRAASEFFSAVSRQLSPPRRKSLGLLVSHGGRGVPTQGLDHLVEKTEITTKEAARMWKTSDRTARTRLRKLMEVGVLAEVGTGPKDPKKTYILKGMRYA